MSHVLSELGCDTRLWRSSQRTASAIGGPYHHNPPWSSLPASAHANVGACINWRNTPAQNALVTDQRLRHAMSCLFRLKAESIDCASERLGRIVFQRDQHGGRQRQLFSNGVVAPRAEERPQLHKQNLTMPRIGGVFDAFALLRRLAHPT